MDRVEPPTPRPHHSLVLRLPIEVGSCWVYRRNESHEVVVRGFWPGPPEAPTRVLLVKSMSLNGKCVGRLFSRRLTTFPLVYKKKGCPDPSIRALSQQVPPPLPTPAEWADMDDVSE